MKKLRVLHILNTGCYSGAENVVITLLANIRNQVDGVYLSPDGTIREVLRNREIEFRPISGKSVSIKELKKAIKVIQPDIIHAHDYTAGIMATWCTHKIPIINHLHHNSPWIKKMSLKTILYGLSCFKYRKILTVSEAVMDEYIFGEAFKCKTRIVGNPISLKFIRDKAQELNVEQNYDIAFLGRLFDEKNPFLFLEIVSELTTRIPNIRAVMIGDGELRDEVVERIFHLKLDNNIYLCGFQQNPYAILNKSKVLCMPSKWEGFGLAAVEALALGKPVVASNVGGLISIIDDSCGCLCYDKQEFVDAIYAMLNNQDIYRKKSAGALKRSDDFDNLNQYGDMIMDIYRSVF